MRTAIDARDLAARAVLAGLFLGLSYRIGLDVVETGRLTGVLLLVSELLVVVLTVTRRVAIVVDRAWATRAVATVSVVGPFLLVPVASGPTPPDAVTLVPSLAGLVLVVGGKVSLGRSFGLLPAHRGLVSSGLYGLVRHPIYLGYLLTHAAFLVANPGAWNLLVLALADTALVVRAGREESTLARDPDYAAYRDRVRWRLLPGVY